MGIERTRKLINENDNENDKGYYLRWLITYLSRIRELEIVFASELCSFSDLCLLLQVSELPTAAIKYPWMPRRGRQREVSVR